MIRVGGPVARVVKADQALIDLWFPKHFCSGKRTHPGDERMGVSARPIDQRFYPGLAQLTKRCVGRESSSPARILRSPIQLIARIGIMGEVSRSMRERRPVCLPIGDEGITTVIGDVQPLMSVRRPGVCLPRSCEEMSVASTRRRPESERSVNVNPRTMLFGNWDQSLKIIECTDVEVAGL